MQSIFALLLSLLFVVSVNAAGIKSGDIVYGHNGNDLVGTVVKTFASKKAEVSWNMLNGNSISPETNVWDCNLLFKKTNCAGGICAGNVVYGNNGNDLIGKVERVFENSKVEVRWNSINGSPIDEITYWTADSLSKQSCSSCYLN